MHAIELSKFETITYKTALLRAADTHVSKELLAYLHYLAMECINGVSGPGIPSNKGVSRVSEP